MRGLGLLRTFDWRRGQRVLQRATDLKNTCGILSPFHLGSDNSDNSYVQVIHNSVIRTVFKLIREVVYER